MALLFRDNGSTGRVKANHHDEFGIDGVDYTYAVAHATLTAKTSYRINFDEYGPLTAAISGNTSRNFRVGIATEANTTGNIARLAVRGYFSSMVTPSLSVSVGHSLNLSGGAIGDGGADYGSLPAEFAVCTTATSSATHCCVYLPGKYITASG